MGGFAARLFIRWLDDRREDRRADHKFHAATALVDDELAANLAMLQAGINNRSSDFVPALQSDAYRAHQLTLALGLPSEVRSVIANACTRAQVPNVQVFAKAMDARNETEAARKALKPCVNAAKDGQTARIKRISPR